MPALKATAVAAAIVAVDLLIRRYLSESASVLLPVLTFAAGIALARRFVGRDEPKPSEVDNAKTRIDRAAVELENLSIGDRQSVPPGPAAIGQDRNSKDTNCEVISFPAATLTHAGVAYASEELGQYHLFTDILSKQMASVSESSEEAAKSILKNLTEIDNQNSVLVSFIQQSGSNEQVAKVVAQIESEMKGCQDLLKRFVGQTAGGRTGRRRATISGRRPNSQRAGPAGKSRRNCSSDEDAVIQCFDRGRARGRVWTRLFGHWRRGSKAGIGGARPVERGARTR